MIVVKVEMYPGGDESRKYVLAVMAISNDGTGTKDKGHYVYALSHCGKNCGKRGQWKSGKVKNFRRNQTRAVYRLIARVLKEAGV